MLVSVAPVDFCARPSAEPTDEAYLLQTSQVCSLIGEKVEAFKNCVASQWGQSQNFISRCLTRDSCGPASGSAELDLCGFIPKATIHP